MFRRYKESIGLEIGDGMVKAMCIQSSAKEHKLVGFEMTKVNFRDGRQGIINAVKDVVSRLSLKRKYEVNISVSGESVVIRDIHWPEMNDEEIRKALKFEVERQVHYKAEEIVFDYYSVLDKSIAETRTRVILVAAKKDLIENYSSLVTSAGYKCGFVEVDTFSLLNCFYLNGPDLLQQKSIAIINVGMEVTNIDIIKGRIVGLTKDAFVAWGNLIEALPPEVDLDFSNVGVLKGLMGGDDLYELCLFILNALSTQIRRTIEFHESQGRDTIEEIFLSGRIAMFGNLDKYLQNVLGLKVTFWNPISKIKCDVGTEKKEILQKNALMLAICTGLACFRAFNINLSAERLPQKKSKIAKFVSLHKPLIYSTLVTIFFLLGVWIILLNQIKIKEANKIKLLNNNRELQKVLEEIDNLKEGRTVLNRHIRVVRALILNRMNWSQKLQAISMSLPKEIWLTEIRLQDRSGAAFLKKSSFDIIEDILEDTLTPQARNRKRQNLVIRGKAYSKDSDKMFSVINMFISNLKTNKAFSKDFEKIELIRSYRDVVEEIIIMRFEVECFLK